MSEVRLIDAEALKEVFKKVYPLATNEMGGIVNKQIYDIIDNAPTIEPKRKFIRIITTYCPDDCICYKEYKGKPYFSIEYQENGETKVGWGTYNPEVLSRYLRDYFFNER